MNYNYLLRFYGDIAIMFQRNPKYKSDILYFANDDYYVVKNGIVECLKSNKVIEFFTEDDAIEIYELFPHYETPVLKYYAYGSQYIFWLDSKELIRGLNGKLFDLYLFDEIKKTDD